MHKNWIKAIEQEDSKSLLLLERLEKSKGDLNHLPAFQTELKELHRCLEVYYHVQALNDLNVASWQLIEAIDVITHSESQVVQKQQKDFVTYLRSW